MEILFTNKRGTAKFCMKVSVENIFQLTNGEHDALKEILSLNDGYGWKPVKTGYAHEHKLPLIGAMVCH